MPVRQPLRGGATHMQHGPIDLVLKAWGEPGAVAAAEEEAWRRFVRILPELAGELDELRQPVTARSRARLGERSPVGRRMVEACLPHREFVTPMAAVAGAVADEIAALIASVPGIRRAFVNDGGDIALVLGEGQALTLGVMGDFGRGPQPAMNATLTVRHDDPVRGVATSGWRGRSFSLGIADAVTVLAGSAAVADAAATLIGNSVDIDHPGVARRPAIELDPDSDIPLAHVTVAVAALDERSIQQALRRGLDHAGRLRNEGLIVDAAISLQGRSAALGAAQAREGAR